MQSVNIRVPGRESSMSSGAVYTYPVTSSKWMLASGQLSGVGAGVDPVAAARNEARSKRCDEVGVPRTARARAIRATERKVMMRLPS